MYRTKLRQLSIDEHDVLSYVVLSVPHNTAAHCSINIEVTDVQISKHHTRRPQLLLWVPTRLTPCRCWPSTVGSCSRGRSLEVRCRSYRTGCHIATGSVQRLATTTTGSASTRSTVSCSRAASASELRYSANKKKNISPVTSLNIAALPLEAVRPVPPVVRGNNEKLYSPMYGSKD